MSTDRKFAAGLGPWVWTFAPAAEGLGSALFHIETCSWLLGY